MPTHRAAEGEIYRPRLVDQRLPDLLAAFPAVLLNGPRAAGKTTTARQHAAAEVRLDQPAQAAAFKADPDAALRGRPAPLLIDEWQEVPDVLGAVKRAVDDDSSPGRFILTGSVRSEMEQKMWPGTGRLMRLKLFGLTEREVQGHGGDPCPGFVDALVGAVSSGDPGLLALPRTRPDLRDYLGLAVRGGFPAVAWSVSSPAMRETWMDSYLDQLLSRDIHLYPRVDQHRLRRYFEALAASSAGSPEHKTIYDAAGVNQRTATLYDSLLEGLFVAEKVPSWDDDALDRLTRLPKRYVVDPSLMVTALGAGVDSVLASDDLMGRLIDTFVMAQIRPAIALAGSRTQAFHLRTKGGREEIDLVIELPDRRVVGLEVKATAAPRRDDAKHLRWLREQLGERFVAGAVLHTGPDLFELDGRILAVPICATWGMNQLHEPAGS